MKKHYALLAMLMAGNLAAIAQNNPGSNHGNKFEQLGTMLQDPNMYRSASGAPGPKYWQQRADYDISATLDDEKQKLTGSETITYFNNSPDPLTYIWLQLDENEHKATSDNQRFDGSKMGERMTMRQVNGILGSSADVGIHIEKLTDANGAALPYTVNQTMMRIDLPKPLMPGEKLKFKVDWWYNITDRMTVGVVAVVMNSLKKMVTTCTRWHNGTPALPCIQISRAGKTNSLPVVVSLHLLSATSVFA